MLTVEQIKSQNALLKSQHSEFKKYFEAYSGGTHFKNTENIRKFYSDRAEDYTNILNLLPNTNLCRNLVENRVNTVFETEPKRHLYFQQGGTFLDHETAPGLRSFLYDATFEGLSFSDFMEEVATQASIYGHVWVFVDKPAESQIDVNDPNQNRPYLQILVPSQVLDWKYSYVGGKQVLQFVKFVVNVSGPVTTYCVGLSGNADNPTTIQMYQVHDDMSDKEEVQPISEVQLPLGMGIPMVKSFARKDPVNSIFGVSDIKDAVYFQRFIANLDREVYESIIYKKSILKLPSDIQTPEGGGMGIVRGEIEELDAVDFAVPDTADIDSVREYMTNVIERYAILNGIQSQTGISSRSGESFYQERKNLYRYAASKARNLEVTETLIFDLFGSWQNLRFAGAIEYDTNYSEKDVEMKLFNLEKAKQIAPDSAMINTIVERELIKLIGNEEDNPSEFIPKTSEIHNTTFVVSSFEEVTEETDKTPEVRLNGEYDERLKFE